jgi:hypothetical protein
VSGGCDVWKSKCLTLNEKIKKINGEFCHKNCVDESPTIRSKPGFQSMEGGFFVGMKYFFLP